MSDEQKPGSAPGSNQADPLTNVKAEMNRKFGNVDQKLATIEQTNQALLKQLQAMSAPAKREPAHKESELKDIWFDNPDVAAETVISAAEKRIEAKLAAQNEQVSKQNKTINKIAAEFPEIRNADHALTKKAVEIYDAMSEDEKTSPAAYRAAVTEAAMELKIMPKSKRTTDESDTEDYSDNDDFSLRGGSSSSSNRNESRRTNKKDGLSQETIEFAKLMGLNTDDPKVRERIKSRQNRKYGRYE